MWHLFSLSHPVDLGVGGEKVEQRADGFAPNPRWRGDCYTNLMMTDLSPFVVSKNRSSFSSSPD